MITTITIIVGISIILFSIKGYSSAQPNPCQNVRLYIDKEYSCYDNKTKEVRVKIFREKEDFNVTGFTIIVSRGKEFEHITNETNATITTAKLYFGDKVIGNNNSKIYKINVSALSNVSWAGIAPFINVRYKKHDIGCNLTSMVELNPC